MASEIACCGSSRARRIYRGDGGGNWVAEFACDLAAGLFGAPVPWTNPAPDAAQRAA